MSMAGQSNLDSERDAENGLSSLSPINPVTLEQPSSPKEHLPSPPQVATNSPASPTRSNRKRPTVHTTSDSIPATTRTLKGIALFRSGVRRVIVMRKASTCLGTFSGAGAEPGVDPYLAATSLAWEHVQEKCDIKVVDYNSISASFRSFNNTNFVNFLDTNGSKKPPWVKVRWISIGGVSWDVISSLALTYDIHPLALEDVLRKRSFFSSKADYYPEHLFIRLLCHSLGGSESDKLDIITDVPQSASPIEMRAMKKSSQGGNDDDHWYPTSGGMQGLQLKPLRQRKSQSTGKTITEQEMETDPRITTQPKSRTTAEARVMINQLKEGHRVNVLRKNLYIFLFRDGTLITIHESNSTDFAVPIMTRLRSSGTVLRSTADASLLLESVLDIVVDKTVEIVEEYEKMILKLERDVLVRPTVRSIRHLHILSGDLNSHRQTMTPLKTLIYGLRRYDKDRSLAVAVSSATNEIELEAAKDKATGYMSHKSKIYLTDVQDHAEHILSGLEVFAGISENLISLTFNMASYDMNMVMRRLTVITIISLPLTFLTGYFGMNFIRQPSVNDHSDVFFWEVAIPLMAVVTGFLIWTDLITIRDFIGRKENLGLRWNARGKSLPA